MQSAGCCERDAKRRAHCELNSPNNLRKKINLAYKPNFLFPAKYLLPSQSCPTFEAQVALPGRCDLGQVTCALLTRSGCTKLKDGGGSFCMYVFTCIKGQADGNSAKLLTLSPDWHSGRVKEKIQQNYLSVLPVRTHTKEPLRAFPNLWICLILFQWY